MNKKFLPVLLALTGAGIFLAFQTRGLGDHRLGEDNPKARNEKILRNVGLLLEQGHYSPKKIDDVFSKAVLKSFVEDLDGDKSIFLRSDMDSFKRFENVIDDEIHGASLESFYYVSDFYTKRLKEASKYFDELLATPFNYNLDESIVLDNDKLQYAQTEAERKAFWYKRLKYLALTKYNDMLDDREKNKGKKDFVEKADTTLEREARDQVRKQMSRYFTTLKTHNTSDEMFSTFVNAITSEMDPHTNYFAPVDNRAFTEQMSGRFYGIGAQLKEEDSKIKIASLIAGGPAWKSGELGVNDELVKIGEGSAEPVDVTGYAVSDAVKLIRGAQAGTEVRLTVRKPDGSLKVVILKRDEIKTDEVYAKSAIINGEKKIGYINLPEFYMDFENPNGAKCSEDVAKEIKKLKAANVEGIIMDLRGNGGGSLPEVVKMVGLFIEDGPVCMVRGRDEKQPFIWKDRDKSVLYTGPLTVLVDEGSASASEIFAAAIQDYKRGIVIGTGSYGKGTVQRTIPLNPDNDNVLFGNKKTEDLGSVKLTLQKFYRISGGSTQLKGVTPDVLLPNRQDITKSREKDNPSALSWDEIEKTDYRSWVSNFSTDAVIKSAIGGVKANTVFSSIQLKIDSISKENDKVYSLNLAKYRLEQKQLKTMYKDLEKLLKLPKEMDVKMNPEDAVTETKQPAVNDKEQGSDKDKASVTNKAGSEKAEKVKRFLNAIKEDVYIDEAVKITSNMVTMSNLAVNDKATAH